MDKKKLFLLVQSILCVLIVLLLAVSAFRIYQEGLARRAADPLSAIYSREIVAEALTPILPLIFLGIGLTAVGLFLKIKDEKAGKPIKNADLPRKRTADGSVSLNMGNKIEPARMKKLRKILCALAVYMIVVGIFNGSARDVLIKAINICTECIGLG